MSHTSPTKARAKQTQALPQASAPRHRMPLGACDCHCHVFGPYDRYPLAPQRTYTPAEAPAKAYLNLLDTLGMDRGVLIQASAHGMDNRAMLAALRSGGERLRAVAVVDASATIDELADLQRQGVSGLRFARLHDSAGHPLYQNTSDISALPPLVPMMKELGLHAQLWTHASELPALAPLIRAHEVPYVIDHMGRPDPTQGVQHDHFQLLCALVSEGHLYVKLTPYRPSRQSAPFADMRPYHERLLAAQPNRLLWGSDWPHINLADTPDAGQLLDLLHEWTCDPALLHTILVANPSRLYGF